jgi:hypothetical protein
MNNMNTTIFTPDMLEDAMEKCLANFGHPDVMIMPCELTPGTRAIFALFDFLEKLGLHPWDQELKWGLE